MALLGAGVAACDSPEFAACEVAGPGGQAVANTSVGAWPAELSWSEVWRVGGVDETQQLIFPADVAVSPDGSVAIADWGLGEVILVDADGAWRGPVMTRGEGPGEVQAPGAVTWVEAGTLLVLDFGAARLVTLDVASGSSGTTAVDPMFLSPVIMSGEVTFVALQPDGTVWLEFPGLIEGGWAAQSFVRWSPEAADIDPVAPSRARVLEGVTLPAWPRSLLGVGAETWVLSEPNGRYELTVFGRDDEMLVRFCHPGEALPLSPAERGEGTDESMPEAWRLALRDMEEPPEPAVISRIVVDADGRIWVQRDRPLPGAGGMHGEPGARYDVFLPSGRFLGAIRLPDDHRWLEASGRRVWTLHTGSFDEASITALDIEGL